MNAKHEFLDYLEDILDAIEKIESFTTGMTYHQFSKDDKTMYAVIRAFEIIGEATKNIPARLRRKHEGIPWKEMAGMRDKMIHEYFGVDLKVVWETVQKDIPSLKPLMVQVIEQESKEESDK